MNKPSQAMLKLIKIGRIHGVNIRQKQTGTDTADTFCTITGADGKVEGLWSTYSEYITVSPFFDGIAEVSPKAVKEYNEWIKFERENKKDLAEYKRLKEKFRSTI